MKTIRLKFLSVILLLFILPVGVVSADNATRQKACDYMRKMATIEWKCPVDMEYWNPKYGVLFKKDCVYRGIPYSQSNRETDLETFADNIGPDGYYKGSVYNPIICQKGYLGSDCASAVHKIWKHIGHDVRNISTYDMVPGRKADMDFIFPVGGIVIKSELTTKENVNIIGKEATFEAYNKLKPGDALLMRCETAGHVALVVDVDPLNQVVKIIDQAGSGKTYDGEHCLMSGDSTWRVDFPCTYEKLFAKGYIPITVSELTKGE